MPDQELMSVAMAAKRLGVSTETIRRMIFAGELPSAYRSRPSAKTSPYVIPLADIVAIEEQRRAGVKQEK